MKLLITDLDNTLYDWVSFYAASFEAMVAELSSLLGASTEQLVREFRDVHRSYGSSEPPFAVLELPTVREKYGHLDKRERKQAIDPALHAFNSQRKRLLRLYPGVREALDELLELGVTIVAHTEASRANAHFRLEKLGIAQCFKHLYVVDTPWPGHPNPERMELIAPRPGFVRTLPQSERKPNPRVIADICRAEGFALDETWYVGDSLIRDIAMARDAGVHSAWARYGTFYDAAHWNLLVAISHWTSDDVAREDRLKRDAAKTKPELVLSRFSDLVAVASGNSLRADAPRPQEPAGAGSCMPPEPIRTSR